MVANVLTEVVITRKTWWLDVVVDVFLSVHFFEIKCIDALSNKTCWCCTLYYIHTGAIKDKENRNFQNFNDVLVLAYWLYTSILFNTKTTPMRLVTLCAPEKIYFVSFSTQSFDMRALVRINQCYSSMSIYQSYAPMRINQLYASVTPTVK